MKMKLAGFFQVPMVQQVLVRLDPRKYSADCNPIKDGKGVEKLDPGGRNSNCLSNGKGRSWKCHYDISMSTTGLMGTYLHPHLNLVLQAPSPLMLLFPVQHTKQQHPALIQTDKEAQIGYKYLGSAISHEREKELDVDKSSSSLLRWKTMASEVWALVNTTYKKSQISPKCLLYKHGTHRAAGLYQ